MGKQELDMSQYYKIFGTCRIPALPEDCIEYNIDTDHIVLAVNNNVRTS